MGIAGIGHFIVPRIANGTEVTTGKQRGVFTLTANTTYYYVFGGAAASRQHVHITGYTAGLVITSATIQTCSRGDEVAHTSTVTGEWIPEDPTGGNAEVVGTGWSSASAVVAADGSGIGGASFLLSEWGANRTRLVVVVGATGGDMAVAWHGKE